MEDAMHQTCIDDMVRKLGPILKDKSRAELILKKCWQHKMALVWTTEQVHTAANEVEVALTEKEAIQILETLHYHHNPQYGIRWEDLTTHIKDNVLGRKLNQRQILKFVQHNKLTVHR